MSETRSMVLQVAVTPAEYKAVIEAARQHERTASSMARIMLLKGLSRVGSEAKFNAKRRAKA